MIRNLTTLAMPAAIAASFLVGCTTPLSIIDRTDPSRPSIVQVREGYDTFGRKWEVLSRHDVFLQHYSGNITDIDLQNRELTLKSADGRLETFIVDKQVQRFDEARVGDNVTIDYYLGMESEVRSPTDEEKANPLMVQESTKIRTGQGQAPEGFDSRRVRAVATIQSLDKSAQTVTVKGPRGLYYTTRVKDPSRLDKVRVGQSVLITFTEAAAVSLRPSVETRTDAVMLNCTGTITDIDHADREMTLKGSDGRLETFYVDKAVQRFNEAKVGDKVSLDYYLGVSAEIRQPTAAEKQNPLVVLDATGKASPEAPPTAYGVRQVRAVVTIESLDRKAQTVTVKGPRGKYFTARVADSSRFERVRIGDTILLTFTEAAVVSLKPAAD